jgi:hypothetical protein
LLVSKSKKKKAEWGGAREGSGRPALNPEEVTYKITVCFPASEIDAIHEWGLERELLRGSGEVNISAALREIVQRALAN